MNLQADVAKSLEYSVWLDVLFLYIVINKYNY